MTYDCTRVCGLGGWVDRHCSPSGSSVVLFGSSVSTLSGTFLLMGTTEGTKDRPSGISSAGFSL